MQHWANVAQHVAMLHMTHNIPTELLDAETNSQTNNHQTTLLLVHVFVSQAKHILPPPWLECWRIFLCVWSIDIGQILRNMLGNMLHMMPSIPTELPTEWLECFGWQVLCFACSCFASAFPSRRFTYIPSSSILLSSQLPSISRLFHCPFPVHPSHPSHVPSTSRTSVPSRPLPVPSIASYVPFILLSYSLVSLSGLLHFSSTSRPLLVHLCSLYFSVIPCPFIDFCILLSWLLTFSCVVTAKS